MAPDRPVLHRLSCDFILQTCQLMAELVTQSTPLDPNLMFWGRFEPFRYCMKLGVKPAELVPLTHKFTKSICVRIFHNELTQSTPLDPKHVLGPFRTVLLLHESRRKMGRTGAINEQVR
jgi:hypothetical protein